MFLPKDGVSEISIVHLKITLILVGFEPINLGSKGRRFSSRPPRLTEVYLIVLLFLVTQILNVIIISFLLFYPVVCNLLLNNLWTIALTCSCGSIIRGHLPARVTRIAFSVDTWSLGSPQAFHCLISYWSARTPIKLLVKTKFLLLFFCWYINW